MTSSAEHKVLLENSLLIHLIFSKAPVVDLLLAQAVCRTWRDAISNSKVLQKKLFLLPDYGGEDDDHVPREPNPLLVKHFSKFFRRENRPEDQIYRRRRRSPKQAPSEPRSDAVLGPLAFTKWYELMWNEGEGRGEKYARKEASWRRMVVCRPAPRELQVLYSSSAMGGDRGTMKRYVFGADDQNKDEFLTFGVTYDIMRDFALPAREGGNHRGVSMEIVGLARKTDQEEEEDEGDDDKDEQEVDGEWALIERQITEGIVLSSRRTLQRMRTQLSGMNYLGQGAVVVNLSTHRGCTGPRYKPGGKTWDQDFMKSEGCAVYHEEGEKEVKIHGVRSDRKKSYTLRRGE